MYGNHGNHAKVKGVQVTFDDRIKSIEVEYEGTSLKSRSAIGIGLKHEGFTLSSDEYITEVSGYCKTIIWGRDITSLTFKTNKKTYGLYGNKTSNYFSITAPKDKQIVGFLGNSSYYLHTFIPSPNIDAIFAPVPPPGSTDGNTGGTIETGSNKGGIESNTGDGGPRTNTGDSKTTSGPGTIDGDGSKTGSGTTGVPGMNPGASESTRGPATIGDDGSKTGSGTTGGPGTTPGASESTGGPGMTGHDGSKTGSGITGATMSWDDGKHAKVKRVQLTFDDAIRSIEVEYEGTSLKSQSRGTIGTKLEGFTLSSDEYITEVSGYCKTIISGRDLTSLTFKTNKKTYGPYGNRTNSYFSISAPKDNQIAGFLGSSSHALNSIDVHFAPIPLPGSTGGNTGGTIETGSNKGGIEPNTGDGGLGTNTGDSETIGGPGMTDGNGSNTGSGTTGGPGTTGGNGSNTGSGTTGGPGSTGGNRSNTGSGTTGGPGTTDGNGSNTGSGTTGGQGTTGGNGSNTGSTTTGGPETTGGSGSNTGSRTTGGPGTNTGDSGDSEITGSGSNNNSSPQKLEAQGGKGVNQWDDGADHDGVTKIHVAEGGFGIEQIKFDYVKNGESKEGPFHGVKGRGDSTSFVINHPDEYLVSVEGWYDNSSNNIQGIQFKTNTKTSKYFGYPFSGEGRQFSLEIKDKKIIGFHGFADSHLNSLGAYFVPVSPPATKVEAQGGNYGDTFDDGAFDHVRKVYVGQGESGVAYVKFDYEKDGKIETREYGKMTLIGTEEFEVDSGDYITSIDVYVDKVYGYKSEIVIALTFKTFKGKTSQRFGFDTQNKYELKDGKGGKLAGFHGKAGDVLYALGAYFTPIAN